MKREYSNPVLTKVSTQAFTYCTISKFLTLRQNGGVDWQGNRLGVSPDSYNLGSDKMAKNLPLSERISAQLCPRHIHCDITDSLGKHDSALKCVIMLLCVFLSGNM